MKNIIVILFLFSTLSTRAQSPMTKLVKKATVSGSTPQYIRVNMYDSAGGNIGKETDPSWNNWSIEALGAPGANSGYFVWSDGTPSGVRAKWTQSNGTSGIISGYNDNGSGYASGESMTNFIQLHFRSHAFTTSNDSRLIISGLPDDATNGYEIYFLASRSTGTSRPMTVTANGVNAVGSVSGSTTLETMNNYTNEFVMLNVTPVGGIITLTMLHTNGDHFINNFIVKRKN